jgi:hypothetical protein
MVRTEGGRARPDASRARSRAITARGASPAEKAASASARRAGHEYDPGRDRVAGEPAIRARWPPSARSLALVKHPAPRHAAISDAAKSRPARRVWNSTLRCPAHNHTDTPPGRCISARSPSPGPMHKRHGGRDPSLAPL